MIVGVLNPKGRYVAGPPCVALCITWVGISTLTHLKFSYILSNFYDTRNRLVSKLTAHSHPISSRYPEFRRGLIIAQLEVRIKIVHIRISNPACDIRNLVIGIVQQLLCHVHSILHQIL